MSGYKHTCRAMLAAVLVAGGWVATARADDYHWTNTAGGTFNSDGNWNLAGWPSNTADNTYFDLNAEYAVNVALSQMPTNDTMYVTDGHVMYDAGPYATVLRRLFISYGAGENGKLTLTNGTLHARSRCYLGQSSPGELVISNGAAFVQDSSAGGSNPYFYVGQNNATRSRITVTGAGSLFRVDSRFYFGAYNGANVGAELWVRDGARVEMPSATRQQEGLIFIDGTNTVYDNASSTYNMYLNDCWLVVTNGAKLYVSTGQFGITSGRHEILVHGSNSEIRTGTTTLFGDIGGVATADVTIADGGLIRMTGTTRSLMLREGSSFTLIEGQVRTPTGWHSNTGYKHYYNDGVTRGTGRITTGSLENRSTLQPGYPLGKLEVDGVLNLWPQGVVEFELGGTTAETDYDVIDVIDGGGSKAGEAWLGGTVTVSFVNGFLPQNGDTFDIVTAVDITNATLDSVTFDLPTQGGITWETDIAAIVGGEAVRLTPILPPGGTIISFR